MLVIKKINGIRGFMPITYAVYDDKKIIKIFTSKKEAEAFVTKQK